MKKNGESGNLQLTIVAFNVDVATAVKLVRATEAYCASLHAASETTITLTLGTYEGPSSDDIPASSSVAPDTRTRTRAKVAN